MQIERALSDLPDTRSVFAERTTGGYFLDFTVNREAAARYGLTVGDVNDVVETAIGGKTDHHHRRRPGALPGERAIRARFPPGHQCAQAGARADALRRAGAHRNARGHPGANRAAGHPHRERPTRRLRLRRCHHERYRRLRAPGLGAHRGAGALPARVLTCNGWANSNTCARRSSGCCWWCRSRC